MTEFGDIIEAAKYYAKTNGSISSVLATCLSTNFMSTRQEEVLISAFQKAQKNLDNKKNATFVGKIGDKMELAMTLKWEKVFRGTFGPFYISTYVDDNGNFLTYKGSSPKGRLNEKSVFTFVVKEHEVYNERKSTVISRIKEKK